MIDTKTEELASLYALDLLEGDELIAFELRMEKEPDVMRLVRQLSTGLHAPMKSYNGPERMDLLQGIRERLALAPGESPGEELPVTQDSRRKVIPLGWLQAATAAAAVLLVLNLMQYFGAGSDLPDLENELTRSRMTEQALLVENETIKAFNKSWETEYMNLAKRLLPFVESRDGLGQFTVIDLVDVSGRGGNPYSGEDADISEYFLSRSPLKFASVRIPDIPETSEFACVGYAVWKGDEKRGYLDLYNLVEAQPGRAPFLWMRSSAEDPYLPVGFLPSLDRGTGTFYFTVDQEHFNPTSILITEESLSGPSEQPSSHFLMVGP